MASMNEIYLDSNGLKDVFKQLNNLFEELWDMLGYSVPRKIMVSGIGTCYSVGHTRWYGKTYFTYVAPDGSTFLVRNGDGSPSFPNGLGEVYNMSTRLYHNYVVVNEPVEYDYGYNGYGSY